MDYFSDFILQFEGKQRNILQILNDLIVSFPGIVVKKKYNLPFYYRKSWICYLSPVKGSKVELAFTRGNELSNEQGLLDSKGRKQVYSILFSDVNDIPAIVVQEILNEAILLDETTAYASKRRK